MSKVIVERNQIDRSMRIIRNRRIKLYILNTVIPNIILIAFGIIFIFPFLWLVSSSLKTVKEIFDFPPKLIPNPPQWINYVFMFKEIPFLLYFRNSLILAIVPVIGQLVGSPLTAYSLARIPWKGSNFLFGALIATMILPYQVTMIPIYVLMSKIHWTGTMLPLTVLYFFGYPYYIFLLRQFFKTIPAEISESARIDGAGEFRIYWQLILPLARPALVAVGILEFHAKWNDFMLPLMYLNKSSLWTLALGLTNFMSANEFKWEKLLAGSTIFILPIFILFAVGQKQFIKGIATTGFK